LGKRAEFRHQGVTIEKRWEVGKRPFFLNEDEKHSNEMRGSQTLKRAKETQKTEGEVKRRNKAEKRVTRAPKPHPLQGKKSAAEKSNRAKGESVGISLGTGEGKKKPPYRPN